MGKKAIGQVFVLDSVVKTTKATTLKEISGSTKQRHTVEETAVRLADGECCETIAVAKTC